MYILYTAEGSVELCENGGRDGSNPNAVADTEILALTALQNKNATYILLRTSGAACGTQ